MEFPLLNLGLNPWMHLLKKVINGDYAPFAKFLPLSGKTSSKRTPVKKKKSPKRIKRVKTQSKSKAVRKNGNRSNVIGLPPNLE